VWEYDSRADPALLQASLAGQLTAQGWSSQPLGREWHQADMDLALRVTREGGLSRVRLLLTPR
jgi:hypothetical protein